MEGEQSQICRFHETTQKHHPPSTMNSLWHCLVHLNWWHHLVQTPPFCRHSCREIEVGPILEHLVFIVTLNNMCYVFNDDATLAVCCSEQQSPHSVEMRVCARCVSNHVLHLQIVCSRSVIAPDAVTKPVHCQTSVCGLRNRGCNSKTLRAGCDRQCQWMFALFAIHVKWHVVLCGATTKHVGAKNI